MIFSSLYQLFVGLPATGKEARSRGRPNWRFWAWPSELRRGGVLSMNHRNSRCILGCNSRHRYPRVDDKQITKHLCRCKGIPVPDTFAVIERQGDIRRFPDLLDGRQEFVMKPARGAEGRGIMVIAGRSDDGFTTSSGQTIPTADVRYHLAEVLCGLYSLSGLPDRAIIEQRIARHPAFDRIAVGGTPDIRIILYRRVPVMAMVRLPTAASRGRANLHQGAAAAAVHLASGVTFGGICQGRSVAVHPDTAQAITGVQIPLWNDLLAASINLADVLELGYLGVDFVLDRKRGPVVLEANARPGLAIQLANRRGLLRRLDLIDRQPTETMSVACRLDLVQRLAEVP